MIYLLKFRSIPAALFAALAILSAPVIAQSANPYPNRLVTIVAPYPAGGPFDTFVRSLANELKEKWKVPVVVLNKPGALESIGIAFAAKSAPDGYTLLATSESGLTIGPHLYKVPYSVERELAPISRMVGFPSVLYVNKNFPANNLQELLALARKSREKPLSYATVGFGSLGHLPMAQLEQIANVKFTAVPYKGGAEQMPAVIAGHVDMASTTVSQADQFIKSGAIKAIAVLSEKRTPKLPDLATARESGINVIMSPSLSMLAPKGTPDAIITSVNEAIREVMAKPEFKAKVIDFFDTVSIASSPNELRDYIASDSKFQGDRIKSLGLKFE